MYILRSTPSLYQMNVCIKGNGGHSQASNYIIRRYLATQLRELERQDIVFQKKIREYKYHKIHSKIKNTNTL